MPLLGNGEYREVLETENRNDATDLSRRATLPWSSGRRQSQHSQVAKSAIMSNVPSQAGDAQRASKDREAFVEEDLLVMKAVDDRLSATSNGRRQTVSSGSALSDTPSTTAPNSPIM